MIATQLCAYNFNVPDARLFLSVNQSVLSGPVVSGDVINHQPLEGRLSVNTDEHNGSGFHNTFIIGLETRVSTESRCSPLCPSMSGGG